MITTQQVSQNISFPLGQQPVAHGNAQKVAEGMYWIRMPLPFALDHINLWLIEDSIAGRDGWTLIDCGIDSEASRTLWQALISNQLMGKPILRILATHMHPDHLGNAHWLCKQFNAPLWISQPEFYAAHFALTTDSGFGGPLASEFLASHGLSNLDWLKIIENRKNTYSQMVPDIPHQFMRLEHKDIVKIGKFSWQCIHGHGHSPDHISLFSPELAVLISGDMLLPKISTNVSVWATEPHSNPVEQFLNSLKLFENLPEQTLVCPSHGVPFIGVQRRIHELTSHHKERLGEVLQACSKNPQCAAEITQIMFSRSLDLHQITFAIGEALAHLHWWWHKGDLHRKLGEDKVYRFHA